MTAKEWSRAIKDIEKVAGIAETMQRKWSHDKAMSEHLANIKNAAMYALRKIYPDEV